MIEQYLVRLLDTVAALSGKSYPVAAPVGDEELPICLYGRVTGTVARDLSGEASFYTDTFHLHLLGEDMDALCALEVEVMDALNEQNVDVDTCYIYSGSATPGLEDDYDIRTDTLRRTLLYTVTYWR